MPEERSVLCQSQQTETESEAERRGRHIKAEKETQREERSDVIGWGICLQGLADCLDNGLDFPRSFRAH